MLLVRQSLCNLFQKRRNKVLNVLFVKIAKTIKGNTKLASTEADTDGITEANIQYHENPCFVNYQKENDQLDVKQHNSSRFCSINPKHGITQKPRICETRRANCIINFKKMSIKI